MSPTIVLLLVLAGAQTPAAAPGQPAQPTQPRRPAQPTSIEVTVTDRSGAPIEGAYVTAEGPSSRQARTGGDGHVTLRTLSAGTYRLRAEREGFLTLEKEVVVKTGVPSSTEVALSPAPARPEPPAAVPPPSVPAAPAIAPGQPKVVSIPDLAEKQLLGRNAPAELPLGCSGVAASRVIVVRDSVEETIPDVDQMLYVVAGEATLKLGDSEQSITPGWFSIIPRGMRYSLVRKGRNPMIALSILAGPACPPPSTRAPSR